MIHWLARVYRRIGIHAAPAGTLLYWVHSCVLRVKRRKSPRYSSVAPFSRGRFGATSYYDIARLRRTRPTGGLALVFFMGAGDYLMATPLIRALHLAHPDLPIYAFGSSHMDNVSSSLVIDLLKVNPLIDRVFSYDGRPREAWTDYDFQDALKDIPPDFIILPVIYDVEPTVFHRTTSLLETFNLPVTLPLPIPIAYPAPLSERAAEILVVIRSQIKASSPTAIVCTHFGARSSGYEYPHPARLVNQLVRRGCLVIGFSPTGVKSDNVIDIDVSTIMPSDTIELLRALKAEPEKLSIVSVNSLMWPISAALNVPNLGLHVFWDPSIHQYLYPNIFVITPHFFSTLPAFRMFLAPSGAYQQRPSSTDPTMFIDYNPEYVADSFEAMMTIAFI
jgi:hypothetical protein